MPKSYYLPSDDAGKSLWLHNLAVKLPNYGSTLGLSPADYGSVIADDTFFSYCLNSVVQVGAYSQQWTAFKNAARSGLTLGLMPVPPTLGAAPAAVAANIFGRATALVARIKVAPGYTDSIGQALQIVGADQTVDVNTLKPVITAELDASQVDIGWTKQGMDGIELQVDRGTGFVFLAIDTVPGYTDTRPCPPPDKVRSGNTRPSTAKATTASANGAMSSASRWRVETDCRKKHGGLRQRRPLFGKNSRCV